MKTIMVDAPTSELEGAALDWAVAKCEKVDVVVTYAPMGLVYIPKGKRSYYIYPPSSKWSIAGPIIEREGVAIGREDSGRWVAHIKNATFNGFRYGPTALVAAMRCYASSKVGNIISIPKELLNHSIGASHENP